MKKLFLILGLLLITFSTFAQHKESENILKKLWWDETMLNIMLDTRVDFQNTITDGNREESTFRGQTFKIWFAGEIIPGIRYRVRHRFNKPQEPLREGYSGATDQAWLAFDIGKKKKWTITVGKQSVQFGTYEYDYNSADIYLPTMAYSDLDSHKTGVNIAYRFKEQAINLQIVNSDATQFASEAYKKKALAALLLWEGVLFKELLKTRWGYGAFQHSSTKLYRWLTLGTQLNIDKTTIELDYYLGNRNMDYGSEVSNDNLGLRYVEDQSLSLNFKYKFGIWHPFIKGTWNKRHDKLSERDAYRSYGLQAAIELYPFTNKYVKDLRFHIAYAYSNTNYRGDFNSLDSKQSHYIFAGVRWLFKVK